MATEHSHVLGLSSQDLRLFSCGYADLEINKACGSSQGCGSLGGHVTFMTFEGPSLLFHSYRQFNFQPLVLRELVWVSVKSPPGLAWAFSSHVHFEAMEHTLTTAIKVLLRKVTLEGDWNDVLFLAIVFFFSPFRSWVSCLTGFSCTQFH